MGLHDAHLRRRRHVPQREAQEARYGRSAAAGLAPSPHKKFETCVVPPHRFGAVSEAGANFGCALAFSRAWDDREQARLSATDALRPDDVDQMVYANFRRGFVVRPTALLEAQRDLERVKIEAEQQITSARAEAEGQRLQRETISDEILQLRAIEKWDGHLPQVTSGGTPFIDLKAMRGGA